MDSMTHFELHKICRICLKSDSDLLVSIFAHLPAFLMPPIEMIEKLKFFKLQTDDNFNLPTVLCQSCLYRLLDAYQLQQLAETSERRLREFLGTSGAVSNQHTISQVEAARYALITQEQLTKDVDTTSSIYANICDMFERNDVTQTGENIEVEATAATTIPAADDVLNDVEIDVSSLTRSEPDDSLSEVFVGNTIEVNQYVEEQLQSSKQNSNKAKQKFDSEMTPYDKHLKQPFQCKSCTQNFAEANSLRLHERTHSCERRRFQCEICASFFTTSSNLKAHKQVHLEQRNFVCQHCERSFKSARELRRHEPVHKSVKDIICEICHKAFSKANYLSAHMAAVHRGIRRHKCQECGKVFGNRSNLICHMRTHTGEKPFQCKYCTWKFNQSSALMRHMKKHISSSTTDAEADSSVINNFLSSSDLEATQAELTSPSLDQEHQQENSYNYVHTSSLSNINIIAPMHQVRHQLDSVATQASAANLHTYDGILDFSTNQQQHQTQNLF